MNSEKWATELANDWAKDNGYEIWENWAEVVETLREDFVDGDVDTGVYFCDRVRVYLDLHKDGEQYFATLRYYMWEDDDGEGHYEVYDDPVVDHIGPFEA